MQSTERVDNTLFLCNLKFHKQSVKRFPWIFNMLQISSNQIKFQTHSSGYEIHIHKVHIIEKVQSYILVDEKCAKVP